MIVLLLLLAAPDAAQLLRTAWASQYEWKEDKVQNVTLEFRYSHVWGEKDEFKREGDGQVVIVGDEVVRRHYPDISDPRTRQGVDAHLDWVLARFARKPFEEAFKDAKFEPAEKSAFDSQKIIVNGVIYYVKDDRLFAAERDIGEPGKPQLVRVEFKLGDVGGGYAIVGESVSYTRPGSDAMKVSQERSVTIRNEGDRPVPAIYTYEERSAKDHDKFTIEFHTVKLDLPDPITLDAKARDLLKDAWSHRLVLPNEIRIQGEFQVTVDKDLDRARWLADVGGDFQVWGMDKLQIRLDEENADTQTTCEGHIRWIFDLLRDIPFDDEFKGCGFALEPQGAESVVRLYGYTKALAFRIANGAIVGHFARNVTEPGWWTYKTKPAGDGRFLIEKMKREIEGRKIELDFDYQKVRGHQIPKKFGVLGISWGRGGTVVGVAEYSFRKAKVSFPNE